MKFIHLTLFLDQAMSREILTGISRFARENEEWQMVAYPRLAGGNEARVPDGLIGVISRASQPELDRLLTRGVKIVGVSGFQPPGDIPLVTNDEHAIGRMAATYLAEKGFVHYAFAHIPPAEFAALRLQGFREGLAEAGLPEPVIWSGDQHTLRRQVREAPERTGVFAANDNRARHVVKACQLEQVPIPAHLGLLGVDNDPIQCELSPVPISSIAVPFEEIGWQAAALLDKQMRGETPEQPILRLPPTGVVERRSTDRLHVEDELIRGALIRLRQQLNRWEGVDALAAELGISRRLLEQRFRRSTGTTLYQELQRLRIAEARRLLTDTTLPVSEIATRVGLPDINRFGVYFRKATGQSPRQYRMARE